MFPAIMDKGENQRSLLIGEPDCNFSFPSNYVTTTRYHLYSFAPLCLMYQFKRLSNWYFLITAILQSISIISPLAPFSAIAPLVFVLCVSLLREGIEDFLRYRSDRKTNATTAHIHSGLGFLDKHFHEIRVGDIIRVEEDEGIPCDLVLLTTGLSTGRAYVETANLDGEKFLKIKECVDDINQDSKDAASGQIKEKLRFIGLLACDHPNPKLHEFSGLIQHKRKIYPLSAKNILLTGSVLKNTNWIIGVAVYTGDDTKLRQSTLVHRYKMSRLEHLLNRYIIGIILMELILCMIAGVMDSDWEKKEWAGHIYLYSEPFSPQLSGFLHFFTYFLLLNTMLPISLIISLEIIKVIQAFLMMNDLEMKNPDHYAKVSSSSLNEELGMIEYILTDKTGTLTCNKMEFQSCFIGEREYLSQIDPERRRQFIALANRDDQTLATYESVPLAQDLIDGSELPTPYVIYGKDKQLAVLTTQKEMTNHFITCTALCHECVVESKDFNAKALHKQGTFDPSASFHESGEDVKFISQSPDEIALVEMANRMKFMFRGMERDVLRIFAKVDDSGSLKLLKFERLRLLQFSSDRKRSSIIVHNLQDGKIYLYCKGADSTIISRLSVKAKLFLPGINNTIEKYSRRGWRTLVLAFKIIDPAEFEQWNGRYQKAVTTPGKEDELVTLADEIENELYLLGCTGVEDSLQDEVGITITAFLRANIKMWMLTGDKMETAENIAKTCGLIQNDFQVYSFPSKSFAWVKQQLTVMDQELPFKGDFALVIEDRSIMYQVSPADSPIFLEEDASAEDVALIKQMFVKAITMPTCKTVICCRVSPGLKRQVVQLVKSATNAVCLAIGDGANDVAMIKEADIGVGIFGQEGVQAVQASDYALGEFKFLWDLLLAHGHWNYVRQSRMILYFFYKNFVFTIPQFYFSFYCAHSGQTTFDDWYITFYNMILTALPVLSRALLDKDVIPPSREMIRDLSNPNVEKLKLIREHMSDIYYVGQKNMIFNWVLFILWIGNGFLHSFAIFFIPLYVYEEGRIMDSAGHNSDMWAFSITGFTCILFVVNIKLSLVIRYWNWLHFTCILGLSIGLFFAFIFVYDRMTTTAALYSLWMITSSGKYWLSILLVVGIVLVIDGFVHFLMMNQVWLRDPTLAFTSLRYYLKSLISFSKSDSLRRHEILLRAQSKILKSNKQI